MTTPLRLEKPDAPQERIDAAGAALLQTAAAEAALDLEHGAWLRLPWRAVDGLVGGMGRGDVWFVGAFSGHGKTTFLMCLTRELVQQGRTVYYLGTETQPNELRTKLACLRVGVYSGDVLSGASREWLHWPDVKERLRADIRAQRSLGPGQRFLVCPAERVGAAALAGAFRDAARHKADVLIIDHIDHVTHGTGRTAFEDSRLLSGLVLDLAQSTGVPVIAATQLNNEGLRGDRLGLYQPPQPHHVYMGGHKRHIAWGMLGIYRPLRDDLTTEEIKQARAGRLDPVTLLERDTMALACMKHRHYGGNREGQKVKLRYDRGQLFNQDEKDRYATHYDAQRRI